MKLLAERLEQVGAHQAITQAVEDHGLERVKADIQPVGAGSAIARGGAAEKIGADLHITRSTRAALRQAGDQEPRSLALPEWPLLQLRPCVPFEIDLARLYSVPQLLRDDAELRDLLDD